jgi:hypothetical protein
VGARILAGSLSAATALTLVGTMAGADAGVTRAAPSPPVAGTAPVPGATAAPAVTPSTAAAVTTSRAS